MNSHGTLYILSAPSGAGKTSLVKSLVGEMANIIVSVSYTTRPQRPGEVDGVNYHFITDEAFNQLISENMFLEYATVFGHHYGTSRAWVEEKLEGGIDVILEIDWQGAEQICQLLPQSISVFILPPSLEVLLERLRARRQDNPEVIAKRMALASAEMSHFNEYDYLVVNDDFATAVADLKAIVQSRRLLTPIQKVKLTSMLRNLLA
jgi:guanylate kinase